VEETLDYVHMFGAEISSDRRQRLPSKYRQLPFDELVVRAQAITPIMVPSSGGQTGG
jgi:hypothetical protein